MNDGIERTVGNAQAQEDFGMDATDFFKIDGGCKCSCTVKGACSNRTGDMCRKFVVTQQSGLNE